MELRLYLYLRILVRFAIGLLLEVANSTLHFTSLHFKNPSVTVHGEQVKCEAFSAMAIAGLSCDAVPTLLLLASTIIWTTIVALRLVICDTRPTARQALDASMLLRVLRPFLLFRIAAKQRVNNSSVRTFSRSGCQVLLFWTRLCSDGFPGAAGWSALFCGVSEYLYETSRSATRYIRFKTEDEMSARCVNDIAGTAALSTLNSSEAMVIQLECAPFLNVLRSTVTVLDMAVLQRIL